MNKKTLKLFLIAVVLIFAILVVCSIPLHLPKPGNEPIHIFLGMNEDGADHIEAEFLIEPEAEEFNNVCHILEQLSYHISPRAGIDLTSPKAMDSPFEYAFLIYSTNHGSYTYLSVSKRGILSKDNQAYAIGCFGDDIAARWLAELGHVLKSVEPENIERF